MSQTIEYYNQNADAFYSSTVSADMSSLYVPFLACLPPEGKILDCGCGSGRDSKFFMDHGFHVSAIDASRELCARAERYIGIPVHNIAFDEITSHNEYDGIWACASLLHVEKDRLPDILRILHSALKDSGTLYASFKYGEHSGLRNGRYFTDLNEHTLKQLIDEAGVFHIYQMWITGDVRADHENEQWLNLLLKKQI